MQKRGRDLVSFFGLPKARKVETDNSKDGQDGGEQARTAGNKVHILFNRLQLVIFNL